jgi:hypothetical protein
MFNLINLDASTRTFMRAEFDADVASSTLYESSRLSPAGKDEYPGLLGQAIDQGTIDTLADSLRSPGRLNVDEPDPRNGKRKIMAKNTPDLLAEGEFNRFYIRGLCLRAISEGTQLRVVRAKAVTSPRPESEAKLGGLVDPLQLLNDLRKNIGIETHLGLPGGPNSGLSVEIA